ncbi:pyruvate oxidase [Companilactobacillus sp. DQM5]|uniref:pyruvate oxidase n=1 Tax=Companilactobacillus sp. DQM5 TaxID=3463359 RepID=UPI004059527F
MADMINASDAMIKVMEDWGIDHIYGLPGGSIDSTMNALYNRKDTMKYIQVRHEEVGSLAASGEAKITGKIAAAFASAGPGAVHLLNGLYDAKHDNVPVLAIIGQVGTSAMNTDFFQELNENPMFEDVAIYNRTVMTAESLPHVVDQAIKQAYKYSGVAVVTIPTSIGWEQIPDTFKATANLFKVGNYPLPINEDIDKALDLIKEAKRPIIYFGQGAKHAGKELKELSDKLSIPMMSSALAKAVVDDTDPAYMVSAGRVATKPGVDLARAADLILFIGSNYEFGQFFFKPDAKFIQIDIDSSKFGHRHNTDVAILADSKVAIQSLIDRSELVTEKTNFYKAAVENKKNWVEWVQSKENSTQSPLRVEPIFKEINEHAADDAIFHIDVGNVTIDGIRFLNMKPTQDFQTSAWYASMGNALPGAIATQVKYPNRQSWSISGDGGFSMVMQDVMTQVKYHLPIINVVLNNGSLGFIEAEQDDTKQPHSGVDLLKSDFAKAAEAMGAKGVKVTNIDELKEAFDNIENIKEPVVIDVDIENARPLPVEQLRLNDPEFVKNYQAEGLIDFNETLKKYEA